MENSRILKGRHWSPIRKAPLIAAAFGFLVTTAMVLFEALHIELPRDSAFNFMFGLGPLLALPTYRLTHSLGIESGLLGFWGWELLEIVVNMLLAFGLGSAVAWLLAVDKRGLSQRNGEDDRGSLSHAPLSL